MEIYKNLKIKTALAIVVGLTLLVHAELSRDNNGIVSDSSTGLAWQDDYSGNVGKIKNGSWEDALVYCHELSLGGKNDWRVPNIRELKSIIDDTKVDSATSPVFDNISSDKYWTSTTFANDTSYGWAVDFYHGNDSLESKTDQHLIRCVRGGK